MQFCSSTKKDTSYYRTIISLAKSEVCYVAVRNIDSKVVKVGFKTVEEHRNVTGVKRSTEISSKHDLTELKTSFQCLRGASLGRKAS